MKKILTILAVSAFALTFTGSAFAADQQGEGGKTPHVKGFISNGFWDNWELQIGVGPTFNLGNGSDASDAVYVSGYIAAGKWFHPVFGARLTGEIGKYGQTLPNSVKPWSVIHDSSWSFIFVHPDFLVDLTNWIGGYKEKRVWSSILYLGGGVASGALRSKKSRTCDFIGDFGWQNRFKVCKSVSLDLTVEYLLGSGTFRPQPSIKSASFHGLNVYFGASFLFNKRTFDRSGATEDEAKAMLANLKKSKDETAAANAKNAKLQALADQQAKALEAAEKLAAEQEKALKDAQSKVRAQAGSAKEAVETDNYDEMLFYEYGHSALSDTNKKRLDLIAEHINNSDKQVFRVDGFADPQTGSKKANERLAGKRAKIAADYLVSKGVDASRLDVRNCGTTECPFGKPNHNRIVVVY